MAELSRRWALIVLALCWPVGVAAKAARNEAFDGEPPARTPLDVDSEEVEQALRYVMTEMKRLSNKYRYITLTRCHTAEQGPANFDGVNIFLDLEFDMLRNQPSRHDVIVFKDEDRSITGMAIDEFPEVRFRELPDPPV